MEGIQEIKRKPNPRKNANIFSILTFTFTLPIFVAGFKRDFTEEDLIEHLEQHGSQRLGDLLESAWNKELSRDENPSLMKAIFKVFGLEFILLGLLLMIAEIILRMAQPIALAHLMKYYSENDVLGNDYAYLQSGIIVGASFLSILIVHTYAVNIQQLGMKMRVALCSMIYRKALRLSKTSLGETTVGKIVNLLSNDISRCNNVVLHIHYLWLCPIAIILIVYCLQRIIGLTSTVGILFLLLFIPLQFYLSKRTSVLRLKTALRTDERIRLMNEVITGIQVIKMYTWEKPFAKLIAIARKLEIKYIRSTSYIRGITLSFVIFLTRFAIFLTILVYVLNGNQLTAEYVFVVTAFYNILKHILTTNFSRALTNAAEFTASISRLKSFLLSEEINLREFPYIDAVESRHFEKASKEKIVMKNVHARWNKSSSNDTLNDINLSVGENQLVAIIGLVGSGKTSILNVLLNELPVESGFVDVHGKISYASQEPWIFAGSIRQNIIFGESFDEKRYSQVIQACVLSSDLLQFPYGDRTLVGERGVTLSGGQKARVSLARAIYKDADVYLLDDPLSAVDTHVSKQLFEECIKKFLKLKSVILVTHHLQYLQRSDYIYLVENGRIAEKGTHQMFRSKNIPFTKQLDNKNYDEMQSEAEPVKSNTKIQLTNGSIAPKATKEQMTSGSIKNDLYFEYCKANGSYSVLLLTLFLFIATQLTCSGADYFLAYWVNLQKDSTNSTRLEEEERNSHIYVYSSIIGILVVITMMRTYFFFNFCMKASNNLHNNMFMSIVKAPMRFFTTNSSGRILNRFAKDTGSVDELIPAAAMDLLQMLLQGLGVTIVISIINPWLLIPTTAIVAIFYFMRILYLRTRRSLKRLEGVTRSPVFAHMNASLQGVTTIRAFSAQKILEKEFDNHQNLHTSAYYSLVICSKAFGFWIDFICVIYIALVTFSFFITKYEQHGGDVGLAITQATSLTGLFQMGIKFWTQLETQMTSVERMVEYIDIKPEFNPKEEILETNWLSKGSVIFKSVSLRYSYSEPYVLQNINFAVKSREKIGIVGRTGAGKSSLIYALFQLTPTEGEILIDNVNVAKISLESLRSNISIIPQEPVLFSGTIRKNLDPFDEYSDKTLWEALEEVELKHMLSKLPAGLNNFVSESGSNFSVGQRQLICLARAILRKNKILVLDEATANVDPHTDVLIQKAIRNKFVDCTVLTIAHRLNTIMDSDKVLVMSLGKVVEFDHPYLLMKDPKSIFCAMVEQTGSSMVNVLTNVARNSYNLKYNIDQ